LPKLIGGEKAADLVKEAKKSRGGIREAKKEHIKHLKEVHRILY